MDTSATEMFAGPIYIVILHCTGNSKPKACFSYKYHMATAQSTATQKTNIQHNRHVSTLNWKVLSSSTTDALGQALGSNLVIRLPVNFGSNKIKVQGRSEGTASVAFEVL